MTLIFRSHRTRTHRVGLRHRLSGLAFDSFEFTRRIDVEETIVADIFSGVVGSIAGDSNQRDVVVRKYFASLFNSTMDVI